MTTTKQYDAQGRRIRKRVWDNATFNGNLIVDQRFVYDGWNMVAVLAPDASLLTSFLWGLDLSGSLQGAGGVGGLLFVTQPSTPQPATHFVAYDGNGNVVALTAAADGTESARYEYGPFGEPIRGKGAVAEANPFRFSTRFTDDETDLLYYGYRYYNPSTGRWPSRDPIGERGGVNLYGFVGNSPINRVDFLGLDFTNGGSRPVYVIKDGQWILVKPGETVTGDTDGFSIGTNPLTGKADTFKWIDCYDVKITDNDGSDPKIVGPIVVHLTWVGNKHTDGKGFKRKCCCAIPRCAWNEQQKRGGQKPDAQAEFGSNPPPQLEEWTTK